MRSFRNSADERAVEVSHRETKGAFLMQLDFFIAFPYNTLMAITHLLDVHFLISTFGYPGLFIIIFAETGLMLGFFLPGDSLLITAGIFAAKGVLNLWILLPLLFIAATLGNTVGYIFGKSVGKQLFERKDSRLFKKKHLAHAHAFYEKHGGRAIILARFIPIIRTFAPIVAGLADMDKRVFFLYNVIGSLLWAIGVTLAGYLLGNMIPDKYFEPIILGVIIVSLIPAGYELLKSKENRAQIKLLLLSLLPKKQ